MRKILYEAHMVQTWEGSSTAEVLYMGSNAKLQNWKGNAYIDPLETQIRERHGYCNTVEAEPNIQPCHLMREICEQFKITHRNSTPYRPKDNGAVEAANKNIKKILRNMIQSSKQWHEKLPFALLGYHTTMRTSVGATPYLLVYGTEAVQPKATVREAGATEREKMRKS
uniref:Uncharacterized protein LOC104233580 n=1 Tax=Nicotiana sylvestris TaxID=4096 RepID=A0A1U7X367_NICSY|nr:PREDICTED: uncharacterized protein LOC104233580 [Nicotiana sylvestris]